MWESIVTCAPGKNRRTTSRCGSTSTWRRRNKPFRRVGTLSPCPTLRTLVNPAALHPVLEHLQRHRTVFVGCLGDRLAVALLDPGLVRRGAIARQRQPHQPAGGLTRQLVAVEQHLTEHGLCLMLALLGGKAKPARPIAEVVPRRADAPEIEPGQIILRIGIAEIRCGVREHLSCPVRIRLDLRVGNAAEVVPVRWIKCLGFSHWSALTITP